MPVLVCPRCQHVNPEVAQFCFFDGALLRGGKEAVPGQLAREFIFPSGRRCRTFDEFAQGCLEEWVAARDLLRQGVFQQFLGILGRLDLAQVAQEAMTQGDGDIGLTTFLAALPVSRTFQPKLDIHPRRLQLGNLAVGEVRRLQFILTNQGQGHLQGTLKVTEGADWLKVGDNKDAIAVSTARDQTVPVVIDTQKLVAGQTYGGKVTVICNGGVVEVPVRFELAAQPFAKPPYQGVRTPREMAERMRNQPKAAVPMLESGEVARWFASNNWNYPVRGQPIRGVAGVQQFFEAMGLSKPPPVQISQSEVRFRSNGEDPVRFQLSLKTATRKWVYANIESEQPWLRVLSPQVSGPQHAVINLEVDGRLLPEGPLAEGKLAIVANAGQIIPVRVLVETDAVPGRTMRRPGKDSLRPVLTMMLAFLLLRLLLVPVIDVLIPGPSARAAARKLNQPTTADSPIARMGGWLSLPWTKILVKGDGSLPQKYFDPEATGDLGRAEFRHYFAKYFIRGVVAWTWWLGLIAGPLLIWRRRSGIADVLWAVIAGAVAGVVASATFASGVLLIDTLPHMLWDLLFAGKGGAGLLFVWIFVALIWWGVLGAIFGFVCGLFPSTRQSVVGPIQGILGKFLPL